MHSLSVVIPARNEEETIGRLLADLQQVAAKELGGYRCELIVVDDHSTDATARIAREHGARVLSNQYRNGKGNALRYGFERATGELIAMMDADYSHRAEDLPALLRPITDGAGMVIGSRILGGSAEYTPVRAFGNLMLTYSFGLLHGRYLSDALNGYKLFRREVFTSFEYSADDFEIEIELLANALRCGYRIVEVPSHERARAGGVAKSRTIKHGTKFLVRVVAEAMKNRRLQPGALPNISRSTDL